MNNNHLPAGPVVQGVPGQGLLDMTQPGQMPGERHRGGPGAGNSGGGRGEGNSRGGGARRGRHYGPPYQNNHHGQHHGQHNQHGQHSHHGQHNQHSQHSQFSQNNQFNQFNQNSHGQPQLYPAYMNQYPANPYAFGQMQAPFGQSGVMPTGFVPFQQSYGRPAAGIPPQYPMMPPGPITSMPQTAVPAMHHSLPSIPQLPQHVMQHPMPMSPYPRNSQQAPVVVSTPLPQQVPGLSSPIVPQQAHQSPVPSTLTHHLPPMPASLPLPPHPVGQPQPNLPPRVDFFSQHSQIPPPGIVPIPTPTPSSTQSFHAAPAPVSAPPPQQKPAVLASDAPERTEDPSAAAPPVPSSTSSKELLSADIPPVAPVTTTETPAPFQPPLPWLSRPDAPFPKRITKSRRRRRTLADATGVELPQNPTEAAAVSAVAAEAESAAGLARVETPSTQDHPSEDAASTSPTTPITAQPPTQEAAASASLPTKTQATRPTVPAVPVIPAIPIRAAPGKAATTQEAPPKASTAEESPAPEASSKTNGDAQAAAPAPAAPAPLRPQLWTGLFSKALANASTQGAGARSESDVAAGSDAGANGVNGNGILAKSSSNSLGEAIAAYHVAPLSKVPFIEPRGLINTGNMCYMNSILQVLLFCPPFYDFLDQISKKSAYSFKSNTPLLDALINFIKEFKVIDTAEPVDLRRRLKSNDIERWGEAFTPEVTYDAILKTPRFSSMMRGQQQDAEEFLGFLLEGLKEECSAAMRGVATTQSLSEYSSNQATPAASVTSEVPDPSGGGWLEVGPRQRAAVTRSSGDTSATPISSIFGGQLRSELRVPGLKDSVTLESYQALQLDIDSPQVKNIVDAMIALTKPEILHGDFGSPYGKDVSVTKQVFFETLPPVLILHLKRFQFNWQGKSTVKIGKNVGYPLELEIPREMFTRRKRNSLLSEPLPKYRLKEVVCHHGKQADDGHYTAEIQRADDRQWLRIDDTIINHVHANDVAELGSEENSSEQRTQSASTNKREAASNGTGSSNRFAGMGDEDKGGAENGWSKVTTPANGSNKKWSSVANGTTTPIKAATANSARAKQQKDSIKDNKVAYILFYHRIN